MTTETMNGYDTLPPEDAARADLYRLLSLLFMQAPDRDLLERIAGMPAGGDGTLGAALSDLATAADAADPVAVADEFAALFVGMPSPVVMPYRGHYTDGQIMGRALAELRTDLGRLGIARSEDASEPEEHVAVLCEIMSGLIVGAFGDGPLPLPEQKAFFERHIAPWIADFLDALDAADEADFYRVVGRLGRAFIRTEREAFRLI